MDAYENDWIKALPSEPSSEFDEWVQKQPGAKQNALIYQVEYVTDPLTGNREKMMKCRCSACRETFYQQYFSNADNSGGCTNAIRYGGGGVYGYIDNSGCPITSGMETLCPQCGMKITAWHVSRVNSTATSNFYFPCQFAVINGHAALLVWKYQYDYSKSAERHVNRYLYEAFVFVGKKTEYARSWYKYFGSFTQLQKPEKHNFYDYSGTYDKRDIFPFDDSIFIGTELENAKLQRFLEDSDLNKCYFIQYIRTFMQHNQIENLVTSGMSILINDLIEDNSDFSYYHKTRYKTIRKWVNWKEKKPAKMLLLNAPEFAIVKGNRCTLEDLRYYRIFKKLIRNFEEIAFFKNEVPIADLENFDVISTFGVKPDAAFNYLQKQKKKYGKNVIDASILADYYDMARRAGYDFRDNSVKYPKSITNAHDRLVLELDEEEIEKEKKDCEEYYPAFRKLAKKYADFTYAANGLCIRIAAEPVELVKEHKALDHCVNRYIKTHAEGKKCIFFIRFDDSANCSYFTLELDMKNMTVLQNRGRKNCDRTPEVEAFEAEWLEYIKSLRIRKAG